MKNGILAKILAASAFLLMLSAVPIGAYLLDGGNIAIAKAAESTSGTAGTDDAGSMDKSAGKTGNTESGTAGSTGKSASGTEKKTDSGTEKKTDSGTEKSAESSSKETAGGETSGVSAKEPNVQILIKAPSGWQKDSANVSFQVSDLAKSGKFRLLSLKAKVGQNGNWTDVTEDRYITVSENCTVYAMAEGQDGTVYERSRSIVCFDDTRPTLNAAVSDGLLSVAAYDTESGVRAVYVNGYEFKKLTNGVVNIRLQKFDSGYEYFTIQAMDNAGNMSEVYKTKNPYYSDPSVEKDSAGADVSQQLPSSASPTAPASASASVTEHLQTDSAGNVVGAAERTGWAAAGQAQPVLSQSQTATENAVEKDSLQPDGEETLVSDSTDAAAEVKVPDTAETSENSTSASVGKEFYTIQSDTGKVFYLIIDRDGTQEQVHFLTDITENDLLNVTSDNSETLPKNSAALASQIPVNESALPDNTSGILADDSADGGTDSAEDGEAGTDTEDSLAETDAENMPEDGSMAESPLASYAIIGILAALAVLVVYLFKNFKRKQDGGFIEEEDEEPEFEEELYNEDAEETSDDFFPDDGGPDADMPDNDAVERYAGADSKDSAFPNDGGPENESGFYEDGTYEG